MIDETTLPLKIIQFWADQYNCSHDQLCLGDGAVTVLNQSVLYQFDDQGQRNPE